jgi:hypothetical protein
MNQSSNILIHNSNPKSHISWWEKLQKVNKNELSKCPKLPAPTVLLRNFLPFGHLTCHFVSRDGSHRWLLRLTHIHYVNKPFDITVTITKSFPFPSSFVKVENLCTENVQNLFDRFFDWSAFRQRIDCQWIGL